MCLFSHAWSDEADNERVTTASTALVAAVEKAAHDLQAYDPFVYLCYAGDWQDPISSYWSDSVQQLKELRARVDPDGVFTRPVPGGFKIPP